ncbi:MAG TPA: hypothetical protein VER03_24765 [Bryobacteraceae bacterium]|nr:hypothetical protein [Bryobacteraceae bacterium]
MAVRSDLKRLSYAVLFDGARENCPSAQWDERGYAASWVQNVMPGLPLAEIASDLAEGAGHELRRKLRAAHSSSALAINAFGSWRVTPRRFSLGSMTNFRSMRFSPFYERLKRTDCAWSDQLDRLRVDPTCYGLVDAAQLVKHAFGLRARYGAAAVRILYVYWEPLNAHRWDECGKHREDAEALARHVAGSSVSLVAMSYRELWSTWEAEHLEYLRRRYERPVHG